MTTKRTTLHPRLAACADRLLARARRDAFSPDQERDENGKWTSSGAGDSKSEVKKAVGGGYHEIKRNANTGQHEATHTKAGKTARMGTFSSPEKAKAAIAEHEKAVKERLAKTGANSPRVAEQVENAIQEQRQAKLQGAQRAGEAKRATSAGRSAQVEKEKAALRQKERDPSRNPPWQKPVERALATRGPTKIMERERQPGFKIPPPPRK